MDTEQHIRELLLRARDLEQEAAGCRAEVWRRVQTTLARRQAGAELTLA